MLETEKRGAEREREKGMKIEKERERGMDGWREREREGEGDRLIKPRKSNALCS